MVTKEGAQIPFGDLGVELVIDLDNRQQTLRPKRTRKPTGGQVKPPAPTRQW